MFPKLSLKQLIGILVLAAVLFACLPGALNRVPIFLLIIAAVISVIPVMMVHSLIYLATFLFAEPTRGAPSVQHELPLQPELLPESNDNTQNPV